jgi:hypothetical protein
MSSIRSFKTSLERLAVGLAACCGLMAAPAALAWDGAVNGTISNIDVTGGQNYGFRISLSGVPAMCSIGDSWAYLNDTDSNYKTYVAALMLAKAQGKRVVVYSVVESGHCHMGYISVQE